MESTRRQEFPQILVILLIWCAFGGVLVALHAAADIVGPLFLAFNLLITAWPIRDALLRRGVPRPVATVVLGLVVFLVLGIGILVLAWGVSALVSELPDYQAQFTELYGEIVALAGTFGVTEAQVLNQLRDISPSSIAGWVTSALSGISGVLVGLGVLAVMIFMLVLDSVGYARRGAELAEHRPGVLVALSDFISGVRRYWVVTTIFGLIVAVLDVAILLYLGVPLAFVWGIISFLTNYIPNVGFLIGIVPPALMALLSHGPASALWVIAAYSVINFVIQSIIQPKFNGDAVGVTALISFLSLLLWSTVLGPLGALLGLPATLFFKALLIDHNPQVRWFNAFIASDPTTANPVDAGTPDDPDAPPSPQVAAIEALRAGPDAELDAPADGEPADVPAATEEPTARPRAAASDA